jgi:CheY-like chemotaxis protein
VLVVEDDPVLLELMAGAFEDQGATVDSARLLVEAQRHVAQHRPDLIVSDVSLGDGTAIELITWLRSLSAAQGGRTPCLALTGHASFQAPAAAAGFAAALRKPIDLRALCTLAAALLEKSPPRP